MSMPFRCTSLVVTVGIGLALLTPAGVSASGGAAPSNLVYVPLTPCRVIDTRVAGAGGPLIAGSPRTFFFRGPTRNYATAPNQGGNAAGCGVPDLTTLLNKSNLAKAVAINLFAVAPASDGDLRAWPSNQAVPLAAVVTYSHLGTLSFANGVILTMCDEVGTAPCATGDVTIRADFGTTDLVADVVGYFSEAGTLNDNTNLALGHSALAANTTGKFNTVLGARAMSANTTGRNDTAVGYDALTANTTGLSNTALGSLAMYRNTTGENNSASGYAAMYNNTTGDDNTAVGDQALYGNVSGHDSTAVGFGALTDNTADQNTAVGSLALGSNTTGLNNTATGFNALLLNLGGNHNTADGMNALRSNTTGNNNTATGLGALANSTGSGNTAFGYAAGNLLTTGSNNIDIGSPGSAADGATIKIGVPGTQTRAFVAGIRGVTTGVADAVAVMVDSNGQLGTVSSSRRFKEGIRDLAETSERIFDLRPVSFRYKPEVQSGTRPVEFGLIAEEVERVFPELVVHDKDGVPFTVKYHLLVPLLLNELQKERDARHRDSDNQQQQIDRLRADVAALRRRLDAPQSGPPRVLGRAQP